jgi:hypothetical protein
MNIMEKYVYIYWQNKKDGTVNTREYERWKKG